MLPTIMQSTVALVVLHAAALGEYISDRSHAHIRKRDQAFHEENIRNYAHKTLFIVTAFFLLDFIRRLF
jgi:hypothetical protein